MNFMTIALIVIVGFMFFTSSRKQKAQREARANLMDNLKTGDEVVMISGLHGVFHEADTAKGTVTIDCEGVYLVFDKTAIRTVKPISDMQETTPAAEQEEATPTETETLVHEETDETNEDM